MKETTVKLSGHAKDKFLERFFSTEAGLDAAARQRLIARTRTIFTSIRVRKAALRTTSQHAPASTSETKPSAAAPMTTAAASPATSPAPAQSASTPTKPLTPPPTTLTPAPAVTPPVAPPLVTEPESTFDAYAIGLVPIFQREGRDGLIAKLASVTSIDHLRQMAKAQQVVLPQPLRTGDTSPDALRSAIADAVAKRIADRQAAAR